MDGTLKSKWFLALLILVAALVLEDAGRQAAPHQVFLPLARNTRQLAVNPSFESEDGTGKVTAYYTDGALLHDQFTEVNPPVGWTAWWIENAPSWQPGVLTGRPEVLGIGTIPDPLRVSDGARAVKWFTFWRPHLGGIAQQVDGVTVYIRSYATHGLRHADLYIDNVQVRREPDGTVTVRLDVCAWFSSCDYKPHAGPLEADCLTPITWAHQFLSVGVDLTGGEIDPRSDHIQWSETFECYGTYCPWGGRWTAGENNY